MVRELQDVEDAVDEQLDAAAVQLFTGGEAINNAEDVSESDEADADASSADEDDGSGHSDDGSDWSSDGEEEAPKMDKRTRRRAIFADGLCATDENAGAQAAEGDEAEADDSSGEEQPHTDDGNTAQWRSSMLMNQSNLFSVRAGDIKRAIYGETAVYDASWEQQESAKGLSTVRDITNAVDHADESDDDELFQLKRPGGGDTADGGADGASAGDAGAVDGADSVYAWRSAPAEALSRWLDDGEAIESLRRRVVTGGEEAFDDARKRSAAEGEGEYAGSDDGSDDVFGDFQDIESGKLFSGGLSELDKCVLPCCMMEDFCVITRDMRYL